MAGCLVQRPSDSLVITQNKLSSPGGAQDSTPRHGADGMDKALVPKIPPSLAERKDTQGALELMGRG